MDSTLRQMQRLEDALDKIASIIAVVTFAFMTVLVIMQVISRCFFDYSFQWVEEMARYFFIWSTMLASACATRSHLHIGVDILVSNLKGKTQFAMKIIAQIFLIIAICILLVYGTLQTIDLYSAGQTATSFPVPAALLYLSIPLSSFLMLFYAIVQTFELLHCGKYRETEICKFF